MSIQMKKTVPALPVQNIDESIVFYTTKFGFEVGHSDDSFCVLVRDEIKINLWKSNDISWKTKGSSFNSDPICSGAESFLAGTASCRIEVEGIDELFTEYKNSGVIYSATTVVETEPWGVRDFPTLDHHGNLLTFYEVIK